MEENEVIEEETLTDQEEVQEEPEQTVEELKALLKKQQSDSERGVQKLLVEKKFTETVISESKKVAKNQNYLFELYDKDPKVAQKIIDEYYEGQTIDEIKVELGYAVDYNDPATRQRLIDKEVSQRAEKAEIESKKTEFITRN